MAEPWGKGLAISKALGQCWDEPASKEDLTQKQRLSQQGLWIEKTTRTLTYEGSEGVGSLDFVVQRSVVAEEMYCSRYDDISGQYVHWCHIDPAWDESHVVEIGGVEVPLKLAGDFLDYGQDYGQVLPSCMDFLLEAAFPLGDDTPEWAWSRFLLFWDYAWPE
jgi:hypothetical protein